MVGGMRVETVELLAAPDRLIRDAVENLAHPDIERWLGRNSLEAIRDRIERDEVGASVHALALVEGKAVGWAGWLRYESDGPAIETSTYLAAPLWGTQVNRSLKGLLWSVSQQANIQAFASIHVDNLRSITAVRKLWPDVDCTVKYDERRERNSAVFALSEAPRPLELWPSETVERYAELVASGPAKY